MEGINSRIEHLIKRLGKNKNSFSGELGVGYSVIQNIVGERKSKPGFTLLSEIVLKFNVDADWLLTGRGGMFRGDDSLDVESKHVENPEEPNTKDKLLKLMGQVEILKEQLAEERKLSEQRNNENVVTAMTVSELSTENEKLKEELMVKTTRLLKYHDPETEAEVRANKNAG